MFLRLFIILNLLLFLSVNCAAALKFSGITEPDKDAIVSLTITGQIEKIIKKEGEKVKEGDVILELEKEQEELEEKRRKLIFESKVEVNSAKSRLETLRLDYEGTKRIFENTKSISKEELDKKELEFKLAKAELERLEIAEIREELEYKMALSILNKKIIKAPFSGVVTKVFFEEGENCNPQQPLVRIVNTDKCRFVSFIDAKKTGSLKLGQKVKLNIESYSEAIAKDGVIEFISDIVDPSSGLREVKVSFDNSDGAILAGISAEMVIENE